jgi:hypothetical protein
MVKQQLPDLPHTITITIAKTKLPLKLSVKSKSEIPLNMRYMFQKSTNKIKQRTK